MILSDKTIAQCLSDEHIIMDPFPQDWQLQPASVELRLGPTFMSPYQDAAFHNENSYSILPGECILASTIEYIELPDDLVARVEGKSSWGRRFIQVHSTAGFVDPGFKGTITLELTNLSAVTQTLPVGEAIAQVSFEWLDQPCTRPYGSPGLNSHYQHQSGATASALPWS